MNSGICSQISSSCNCPIVGCFFFVFFFFLTNLRGKVYLINTNCSVIILSLGKKMLHRKKSVSSKLKPLKVGEVFVIAY